MIKDTINEKIADALKAKDEIRLSTLRLLSSALNYEFIAKQHQLNEEEEIVVVKREVKKRQDAIDSLKMGIEKMPDREKELTARIEKETKELEILKEYLPEEIGDEQLNQLINDAIKQLGANSIKDMGKVIGFVMGKSKGNADGKKVAELVKSKLDINH